MKTHRAPAARRLMPALCLLLPLCLGACELLGGDEPEEDYFYYYYEQRIPLYRANDHLSIAFYRDSITLAGIDSLLLRYGFTSLGGISDYALVVQMPRRTDARVHYTSYGGAGRRTLGDEPFVRYAVPVFWSTTSKLLAITDQMICRVADADTLASIKRAYHLEEGDSGGLGGTPLLQVTKQSPHDALAMANLLHERPDVESCSAAMIFRLER